MGQPELFILNMIMYFMEFKIKTIFSPDPSVGYFV